MTQELQVFLGAGMQREGQAKQREREILERSAAREGHLLCIWKGSQPVVWGDKGQVARWKQANQGRFEPRPGKR